MKSSSSFWKKFSRLAREIAGFVLGFLSRKYQSRRALRVERFDRLHSKGVLIEQSSTRQILAINSDPVFSYPKLVLASSEVINPHFTGTEQAN